MISTVRRMSISTGTGGSLVVWAPSYYSDAVEAYVLDSDGSRGHVYYAHLSEYVNGSGNTVKIAQFPNLPAGNYEVNYPKYSYEYRKVTVFPGSEADVDFR